MSAILIDLYVYTFIEIWQRFTVIMQFDKLMVISASKH